MLLQHASSDKYLGPVFPDQESEATSLQMMSEDGVAKWNQPASCKSFQYNIENPRMPRPQISCWKCSKSFASALDLEEHIERDHGRIIG